MGVIKAHMADEPDSFKVREHLQHSPGGRGQRVRPADSSQQACGCLSVPSGGCREQALSRLCQSPKKQQQQQQQKQLMQLSNQLQLQQIATAALVLEAGTTRLLEATAALS
jgi:hypothetical protein